MFLVDDRTFCCFCSTGPWQLCCCLGRRMEWLWWNSRRLAMRCVVSRYRVASIFAFRASLTWDSNNDFHAFCPLVQTGLIVSFADLILYFLVSTTGSSSWIWTWAARKYVHISHLVRRRHRRKYENQTRGRTKQICDHNFGILHFKSRTYLSLAFTVICDMHFIVSYMPL